MATDRARGNQFNLRARLKIAVGQAVANSTDIRELFEASSGTNHQSFDHLLAGALIALAREIREEEDVRVPRVLGR